jgi:SAM-dependent methyltransferase
MTLSLQDWHDRFLVQAQWTGALRSYFFDLLQTTPSERILDIGCGTGALLPDLQLLSPAGIFGADISPDHLQMASSLSPESYLFGADVHCLPIQDDSFEMVLSHFFLMWVDNPTAALSEMKRVCRDGGYIVFFAEPDYGGRLDFPPEFIPLREYQIQSLLQAGADPRIGRKLKGLLYQQGLTEIQCGIYEGSFGSDLSPKELDSEWRVLENDLAGLLSAAEIGALRKHDRAARENGSRLAFVPTFYAWGRVDK